MSSPITLTWTFQTLTGVDDPTGVIEFSLQSFGNNVPMADGSILSPLTFSVAAVAGTGSTTIWTNADISPISTFYTLKFLASDGSYIQTTAYVIAGTDGGTVNLNTLSPIATNPPGPTPLQGAQRVPQAQQDRQVLRVPATYLGLTFRITAGCLANTQSANKLKPAQPCLEVLMSH